jgi:hypothetical protein
MAVLRKMQNDDTRLIVVLLLLSQQKTLKLFDIAILKDTKTGLSANRIAI